MAFDWRRRMKVWKLTGSGTRTLVYNCQTRPEAVAWVHSRTDTDATYEITEAFVWTESGTTEGG